MDKKNLLLGEMSKIVFKQDDLFDNYQEVPFTKLSDLMVGDIIVSASFEKGYAELDMVILSIKDQFLIDHEVACLLGNNGAFLFRKK